MNKLVIKTALLMPGKTGVTTFEETSIPGKYISVDPTKTVFPRGRAFLTLEQSASKGASRGMVRAQVPHLSKDGENEAAVTEHQVMTTERDALRGGQPAVVGGNVTDTAEGAAFVAHRLVMLLSSAPDTGSGCGGQVALDNDLTNDPTGLSNADAAKRFANPYVRGQNGLPMGNNNPSGFVGSTDLGPYPLTLSLS